MQNTLAKASFTDVAERAATPIHVHFNPVSLQYRVSNTLRPNPSATTPSGNTEQTKQYLTGSSATLTLELSFDSTDSGRDVRDTTSRIAEFMRPKKDNTAAVVLFSWGSFQFQGMFKSYQETLDFFSPEGVPLRAAVSISMDEQNRVINERASGSASGGFGSVLAVGGNLTLLAGQIGDPRAARGIALANGSASLRLDAGASLEIGAQVSISAAAGFATGASVGFGAGAGAGIGVGVGAGLGASAGVGFGASASAGAGLSVRAGASAGASLGGAASLAPFGELRTPRTASFSLNPQALLPAPESTGLATDAGAGFSLTGVATPGTASLSAKLG